VSDRKSARPAVTVLIRIGICAAVLLVGFAGMKVLTSFKKPPAESRKTEPALRVQVLEVQPRNEPVSITGYGDVRTVEAAPLSAEVAGRVVAVHEHLDVGETIAAGEVLFRIDPLNYDAALRQARASADQLRQRIQRLKEQAVIDARRLKTLQRSAELARSEFQRRRGLYERDKVGSRSAVDVAEQSYNTARDRADQMAETVELYPLQIAEARGALRAAEAALSLARKNLERCSVKAPFDGRVKNKAVEEGQYVTPGKLLVTLANDDLLEIQVPLNSRDARRFLRFDPSPAESLNGWFNRLRPVECRIRWTEDPGEHIWKGRLDRVVRFDAKTRTLVVAVRIKGRDARGDVPRGLPLVEGMFCSVDIPGKRLEGVFSLPRWAVSFQNTVYVSQSGRLKTVPVKVARIQGDRAFVSEGLSSGQQVITTRLINPLENSLLEIIASPRPEDAS
jgi:RND family efflux transporter MFP subunit